MASGLPQRYSGMVLFAVLACMIVVSHACVELIGHAADSLVKHDNGTHWDYGFLGSDWEGVDATGHPWVCMKGHFQSPINIPPQHKLRPQPKGVKTKFKWDATLPKDPKTPIAWVFNNGHTIQIQNFSTNLTGISVPHLENLTSVLSSRAGKNQQYSWVDIPALQFHFHTASEHQIEDMSASMELHVVHKTGPGVFADCPAGCYSVVGIHVHVREGPDHPELAPIFDNAPFHEGASNPLPMGTTLDFGKIYPSGKAYATYKGSLTTPPCTEGLLWHVLAEPIYISPKQFKQYRDAIGSKECTGEEGSPDAKCTLAAWDENYRLPQPVGKRNLFFAR